MSTSSCRFCSHRNAPDAKFCNECGSPLALKPCPNCEAVNAVDAGQCHQCGAPFDEVSATEVALERTVAEEPRGRIGENAGPSVPFAILGDDARAGPLGEAILQPDGDGGAAARTDAAMHVPESLADRLEGEVAAPAEIVKHRAGAVERREPVSNAWDADSTDPDERLLDTHRNRAVSSDRAPFRRVALVAAVIALGMGGYFAFVDRSTGPRNGGDVASAGKRAAEAPAAAATRESASANEAGNAKARESSGSASSTSRPPANAPSQQAFADSPQWNPGPADRAPSNQGLAGNAPATPNPAGAALVRVQPGAPGAAAPSASAPEQSSVSRSATASEAESAKTRAESASRTRKAPDAATLATQRLIARDLRLPAPSSSSPAPGPTDRDAIETQRLIERDLGPFRNKDARDQTGAFPAIN